MPELPEDSSLYLEGILYFNAENFFASHEVWEEQWNRSEPASRLFYQGLIQAAVALHHFCHGNVVGARKLYGASREKLQPYQPRYLGLEVTQFLSEMAHCFEPLLKSPPGTAHATIDNKRIPKIQLNPRARGAERKSSS